MRGNRGSRAPLEEVGPVKAPDRHAGGGDSVGGAQVGARLPAVANIEGRVSQKDHEFVEEAKRLAVGPLGALETMMEGIPGEGRRGKQLYSYGRIRNQIYNKSQLFDVDFVDVAAVNDRPGIGSATASTSAFPSATWERGAVLRRRGQTPTGRKGWRRCPSYSRRCSGLEWNPGFHIGLERKRIVTRTENICRVQNKVQGSETR